MTTRKSRKVSGFTLTEVVIAIGVVAVLLSAFVAVFAPARQSIQNSIAREEADRLLESLETELTTLRPNEVGQYPTSFHKAFDWIQNSHNNNGGIFLYNYRADPQALGRIDDSLPPVANPSSISGVEAVTLPGVRRQGAPLFEEDVPAIQGRIFYVKLTQLVFNNGELVPGAEGQIVDPATGNAVANPEAYPDAVIALRADFYVLPAKTLSYINNAFNPNIFTTPVFSRNLGVRR